MKSYLGVLLAIHLILTILFIFVRNLIPLRPRTIYFTLVISFLLGADFPKTLTAFSTGELLFIYLCLFALIPAFLLLYDEFLDSGTLLAPVSGKGLYPVQSDRASTELQGDFPAVAGPTAEVVKVREETIPERMAKEIATLEELAREVSAWEVSILQEPVSEEPVCEDYLPEVPLPEVPLKEVFLKEEACEEIYGDEDSVAETGPDTSSSDIPVTEEAGSPGQEDLLMNFLLPDEPVEQIYREAHGEAYGEAYGAEEPASAKIEQEYCPEELSLVEADHADISREEPSFMEEIIPSAPVRENGSATLFEKEPAGGVPAAPLATLSQWVAAAFERKAKGDLAGAVQSFLKALQMAREPQTAAALALEISVIYQELGQYRQAAIILKTMMRQEEIAANQQLVKTLQAQLVYLEILYKLLRSVNISNVIYSKLPEFIKIKASIETANMLKEK